MKSLRFRTGLSASLLLSVMALSAAAAPPQSDTPAPASPPAPAQTATAIPADTSTASLKDTLNWICKAASSRTHGTFPGDDSTTMTFEQKVSYSLRDNELTIAHHAKIDDKSKGDKSAFLMDYKTVIPLSKLNSLVVIDKKSPTDVYLFSRDAVIDPANPSAESKSDEGKQFHCLSSGVGLQDDSFTDRESITFESVDMAERAATALRHLARLTGGKAPEKPANEPF